MICSFVRWAIPLLYHQNFNGMPVIWRKHIVHNFNSAQYAFDGRHVELHIYWCKGKYFQSNSFVCFCLCLVWCGGAIRKDIDQAKVTTWTWTTRAFLYQTLYNHQSCFSLKKSTSRKTKLIDIISTNSMATITGHNCKNNPKKLNFRSPQSYWLSAKKYWVNTNRLKKYNLPGGRIAWHWLRQMKVMGPHLEYFLLTQTVDWRKHQWKWRRPHNLATWYNFLE